MWNASSLVNWRVTQLTSESGTPSVFWFNTAYDHLRTTNNTVSFAHGVIERTYIETETEMVSDKKI